MFAHHFSSIVKYPAEALFTHTATASAQPLGACIRAEWRAYSSAYEGQ